MFTVLSLTMTGTAQHVPVMLIRAPRMTARVTPTKPPRAILQAARPTRAVLSDG